MSVVSILERAAKNAKDGVPPEMGDWFAEAAVELEKDDIEQAAEDARLTDRTQSDSSGS